MLKILWKGGEIAPEGQFLLLSTIFSYLMLDFYVKTWIRFSLRDKRLFEITEVEITRVDCTFCETYNACYFVCETVLRAKLLLHCLVTYYSRTSMARTLMARLPWLLRTRSWVPRNKYPWLQIWDNLG